MLERSAAEQGVTLERLLVRVLVLFLADLDSGRLRSGRSRQEPLAPGAGLGVDEVPTNMRRQTSMRGLCHSKVEKRRRSGSGSIRPRPRN